VYINFVIVVHIPKALVWAHYPDPRLQGYWNEEWGFHFISRKYCHPHKPSLPNFRSSIHASWLLRQGFKVTCACSYRRRCMYMGWNTTSLQKWLTMVRLPTFIAWELGQLMLILQSWYMYKIIEWKRTGTCAQADDGQSFCKESS